MIVFGETRRLRASIEKKISAGNVYGALSATRICITTSHKRALTPEIIKGLADLTLQDNGADTPPGAYFPALLVNLRGMREQQLLADRQIAQGADLQENPDMVYLMLKALPASRGHVLQSKVRDLLDQDLTGKDSLAFSDTVGAVLENGSGILHRTIRPADFRRMAEVLTAPDSRHRHQMAGLRKLAARHHADSLAAIDALLPDTRSVGFFSPTHSRGELLIEVERNGPVTASVIGHAQVRPSDLLKGWATATLRHPDGINRMYRLTHTVPCMVEAVAELATTLPPDYADPARAELQKIRTVFKEWADVLPEASQTRVQKALLTLWRPVHYNLDNIGV